MTEERGLQDAIVDGCFCASRDPLGGLRPPLRRVHLTKPWPSAKNQRYPAAPEVGPGWHPAPAPAPALLPRRAGRKEKLEGVTTLDGEGSGLKGRWDSVDDSRLKSGAGVADQPPARGMRGVAVQGEVPQSVPRWAVVPLGLLLLRIFK